MRRTLSYIIFSFIALVSYSQSISDLNNEKEELLNKISYNSELATARYGCRHTLAMARL